MPSRSILAVLLLATVPGSAQAPAGGAAPPEPEPERDAVELGPDEAAAGRGSRLAFGDLDALLLTRFGLSEVGREILRNLVSRAFVRKVAAERGLEVSEAELARRWDELDAEIRAAGVESGLAGELERNRVDVDEFRDLLALSILHERLTRDALGVPEKLSVSGEQQELWLSQEMSERGGVEMLDPPWTDGVVARCDDVTIDRGTYGRGLRRELGVEEVREACYQLLLERRVRERIGEATGPEGEPRFEQQHVESAIDAEIERRRARVEGDPRYEGLGFEDLIGAHGLRLGTYTRDPAIVVAALADLWVEEVVGDEGLRELWEEERALFEKRHGEAVRTRVLYLTAAGLVNELNPRSFEQAEDQLLELVPKLRTESDFEVACETWSEDPGTRSAGGDLGWVTREDPRLPRKLCEAVWEQHELEPEIPEGGTVAGPIRTPSGVMLLWLAEHRTTPGWEGMRPHVAVEAKRRFLRGLLAPEEVVTFVDPPPTLEEGPGGASAAGG